MIELVFVVCTAFSQPSCEQRSMILTDISEWGCLTDAPPHLAKWAAEHPDWRVSRWTCRYLDTAKQKV